MVSAIRLGLREQNATHVWRRPGLTNRNLFWAGSDLAAHPERYVRPDRVAIIRRLNFVGVCLFLSGVLILVGAMIRDLAISLWGRGQLP